LEGLLRYHEEENTEALIDSSKETSLRINTENKVEVSSPECRAKSEHRNSEYFI
jgi:hypothetical protein